MHKYVILIFFTTIFATSIQAQYILKTPDGRKVELNKNGTWQYSDTKSSNTKVKYTSNFKKYSLFYDPSLWSMDDPKDETNKLWDATFHSTDQALSGNCKEYRLSYGNANIDSIIRSTYESIGPISSYKTYNEAVNGLDVRFYDIEVEYDLTGLTYRYIQLLFAPKDGSFQVSIGSQKNVVDEDYDKIMDILRSLIKN